MGDKYRTDVSWDDVAHLMLKVYQEYDVEVVFHVKQTPGGRTPVLETSLVRPGLTTSDGEVVRVRTPLNPKQVQTFWAQFLRGLWDAQRAYDEDPWHWSPERRRRARGEG